MTASPTFTPNVEERLSAAAFVILTDHNSHSHEAERWAVRFLRRATHGHSTAFQRRFLTVDAPLRAFARPRGFSAMGNARYETAGA